MNINLLQYRSKGPLLVTFEMMDLVGNNHAHVTVYVIYMCIYSIIKVENDCIITFSPTYVHTLV